VRTALDFIHEQILLQPVTDGEPSHPVQTPCPLVTNYSQATNSISRISLLIAFKIQNKLLICYMLLTSLVEKPIPINMLIDFKSSHKLLHNMFWK